MTRARANTTKAIVNGSNVAHTVLPSRCRSRPNWARWKIRILAAEANSKSRVVISKVVERHWPTALVALDAALAAIRQ
jgi:hypothetical protein